MLLHKKSNKIIIVSALMLSLGMQSMDVMARAGGGSSRSSGFSNHSYSSGSSQSYYNSSQRAGGGGNVGMQRNDVVNAERQNTAATSNQFNNSQTASQQAAPSKIGLGHVAGAAVAGAAVGYMLNSHNNNQGMQQPMQNNGGASGAFDGISNNQPVHSGFPWGTIFMLLLGGLGLMWLYKRSTGLKAIGANMKEALNPAASSSTYQTPSAINIDNPTFQSDALNFFNALQDANNRGDIGFMQTYSVGDMQASLIGDIKNRPVASNTRFSMMNAKVIDITNEANQSIASVRFTGLVSEANSAFEPMDEVWHLVRQTGEWQLAGIEQV